MTSQRYRIAGMDCAAEIEALRQTVGRLPGVGDLDFNLLDGTMKVVGDGTRPGTEQVLEAVRRAGLEAQPCGSDERPGHGTPPAGAAWWRRRGAILCLASGGLLLAGLVTHAWLHGSLLHALLGLGTDGAHRFPALSRFCYAAAAVAGCWTILPRAWAALRRARPDMNLLMTLAVAGAMGIGEWFEAATVAFLFACSLLLESWSVERARRAVRALLQAAPRTARCRDPRDGQVRDVPVDEVAVGTLVLVRPGERLPLDGRVTQGTTRIDQSPITGEPLPVPKEPGDEVWAGTINGDGAFEFRAACPAADTTLGRIIRMVEESRARRAPAEQWVERFARVYTPLMMLLALLVAILPPLLAGGSWSRWFYEALVLLVIACPCALVISTPVSITAALAAAARMGVLIKGGAYLETAARLKLIALDKTGTVTRGRPAVRQVVPLDDHSETDVLAIAAALETHSDHPLALAIARHAAAAGVARPAADRFTLVAGKGAEGQIDGHRYWIGSHRLLHEKDLETPALHDRIEAFESQGETVVILGTGDHVCGLIALADTVRGNAAGAIADLRRAGIGRLVMLTGDHAVTARAVARQVGLDEFRSDLLPADKLQAIEALIRDAGPTAMIGDGINDAPALAAATLGIAMGAAGSDAAIETADIALMTDDLSRIPWLIRHARRAVRIIRQNLVLALGIKALFIALALLGLASLWMAIAADMGASLAVILNALRLLDPQHDASRPDDH